jgi:MFS family permease
VLRMEWLYAVGFILGTVYAVSGSAAQVVLTQVVPRQRLVEAHARNALATSGAEVAGPGLAGALIKLVGPPLALLMDAALVLGSALILKGVRANDAPRAGGAGNFMVDLRAGMAFVVGQPLLVVMAVVVGGWQVAQHSAMAVQVLLATRELGLTEEHLGLCYALMGLGTIAASVVGNRISARVGPGRALALGFLCSGAGWSVGALSPAGNAGVATFVVMLVLVAVGGVFIFINFLALRQASTPEPLLGRMTTTMRWLILLPAGPGAVIGGLLGDHVGLRAALGFSGVLSTVLGVASLRHPRLRQLRQLPTPP